MRTKNAQHHVHQFSKSSMPHVEQSYNVKNFQVIACHRKAHLSLSETLIETVVELFGKRKMNPEYRKKFLLSVIHFSTIVAVVCLYTWRGRARSKEAARGLMKNFRVIQIYWKCTGSAEIRTDYPALVRAEYLQLVRFLYANDCVQQYE